MSGAAITRDGRTAFTVSWDAKVRVWDVATGSLRHVLGGELAAYFSLTLSPDETRVLAGTAFGGVRVFDVTTDPPRELGHWNAHPPGEDVSRLNFSRDGKTLFTRGPDGVRLWETGLPPPAAREP